METPKRCEICSKFAIKTIADFEQVNFGWDEAFA